MKIHLSPRISVYPVRVFEIQLFCFNVEHFCNANGGACFTEYITYSSILLQIFSQGITRLSAKLKLLLAQDREKGLILAKTFEKPNDFASLPVRLVVDAT